LREAGVDVVKASHAAAGSLDLWEVKFDILLDGIWAATGEDIALPHFNQLLW
jgi:hypothetical protein